MKRSALFGILLFLFALALPAGALAQDSDSDGISDAVETGNTVFRNFTCMPGTDCENVPSCVHNTYGGNNYLFCYSWLNWQDARQFCQGYGGDLAIFNSAEETGFAITNRMDYTQWIGLNDIAVEGTFVYTHGAGAGVQYWGSGAPSGAGDCVFQSYYGAGLIDHDCADPTSFVCEDGLGTDPTQMDTDGDAIRDTFDNCPNTVNPTQADREFLNTGFGDNILTESLGSYTWESGLSADLITTPVHDGAYAFRSNNNDNFSGANLGLVSAHPTISFWIYLPTGTSDLMFQMNCTTGGWNNHRWGFSGNGVWDGLSYTAAGYSYNLPTAQWVYVKLNPTDLGCNATDTISGLAFSTSVGVIAYFDSVVLSHTPVMGDACDYANDFDADALSDLAETNLGTNPQLADTDGDGLNDGQEVNTSLTDPLLFDTDGDLISDSADCAPLNSFHWYDCGLCTDNDADNYGDLCDLGDDCDDTVATGVGCHDGCSSVYEDADGDLHGNPAVGGPSCVPNPLYVADNTDCSDLNPYAWSTCATCADADGDGAYALCDRYYDPMAGGTYTEFGLHNASGQMPLGADYNLERQQIIYYASEVGQAGIIKGIAIYVNQAQGGIMTNFTIRMKHTDVTSYGNPGAWEGPSAGWTTVYQANEPPVSTGWHIFPFTTPFNYNGAQNLMVDFSHNLSATFASGEVRLSYVPEFRTTSGSDSGAAGDPLNWTGTWPTANPYPNGMQFLPDVRFHFARTIGGPDCDDHPLSGPSCDTGCVNLYPDVDGDGFGASVPAELVCPAAPNYSALNTDCEPTHPLVYPGQASPENPARCDLVDNQCPGETGDGIIDEGCDVDSDGLDHPTEISLGTDPNDPDTDDDGLSDGDEVNLYQTSPLIADMDGDGVNDGEELTFGPTTFTCMDGDSCGSAPGCVYQSFGGHNYLFCSTTATWSAARNFCLSYGGDLLQVGDSVENNWVETNPNFARGTFMGLNDIAVEGTFVWAHGNPVTYTHWYPGEPNNYAGNDNCGGWFSSHPAGAGWADLVCAYNYRFICEDGFNLNPFAADSDADGLTDFDEINVYGTHPNLADTDGDQMADGWELAHAGCGLNLLVPDATGNPDGDAYNNLAEFQHNGDPCATTVCSDGVDNDGDTFKDLLDGGCADLADTSERNDSYGCDNGIDNDHDGYTDYPADPDCQSVADVEAKPTLAGTYDTPGAAYNVYVSGNYAYVADTTSGLQIINLSNPAKPTLAGTYDTPGGALSVSVSGKYAYVADYSSGLQIINVSNPASPTLAGTYNTPGYSEGVYVSGNHAYVADSSSLQIIDISNPASPTLAGTYDTPGYAYSIYVSGNYAYVADYFTLQIIDISNPASPTLAGTYDTPGNVAGVYASGNYAYVADYNSGLQIISLDRDGDGVSDWYELAHSCMNVFSQDQAQDPDADGLTNYQEFFARTDPCDSDSDNDGLSDGVEKNTALTNPLLADTDGDGLNDGFERAYPACLNPTDAAVPASTDADADGLTNPQEFAAGSNPCLADTDSDGLSDAIEANTTSTNPAAADSDGDGLDDFDEIYLWGTDAMDADMDGDGLTDYQEVITYHTDPWLIDSDGDGVSDYSEVIVIGGNPVDNDSDDDGVPDNLETGSTVTDNDGDGLPNAWEKQFACLDPATADGTTSDDDADGLNNLAEFAAGTNPCTADTDGDGLSDSVEVNTRLTDPTLPDTDGDGLTDGVETDTGTFVSSTDTGSDPLLSDTDGDAWSDGLEVDRGSNPNSPSSIPAGFSHLVNYQGRLANGSGVPVSGSVPMGFALFGVASGGTPLWSESQTVVVTNGIYNVLLGSMTPLTAEVFSQTEAIYLQVTVNGETLSPRTPLTSVPSAMLAERLIAGRTEMEIVTLTVAPAAASATMHVSFRHAFTSPPKVMVGPLNQAIGGQDFVPVRVENVSPTGFDVIFRSLDGRAAAGSAGFTYQALGD